MTADLVEEAGTVAEDHGHAGDGIPDNIAESAQACERGADFIPVGVESCVFGSPDAMRRCAEAVMVPE